MCLGEVRFAQVFAESAELHSVRNASLGRMINAPLSGASC